MSETPAEQRQRLYLKRQADYDGDLIKCLECNLAFMRVGSHVVQVHGYESAKEYRKAHGLDWKTGRVTTVASHREHMSKLVKQNGTINNLEKGAPSRFIKGGGHGKIVSEYWRIKQKTNVT